MKAPVKVGRFYLISKILSFFITRPAKRLLLGVLLVTLAASKGSAQSSSFYGASANGVCEAGECPRSESQLTKSITQPLKFSVTLANADMYQVVGSYLLALNLVSGATWLSSFSTQYVGNTSQPDTPSQNDTLTTGAANNVTATTPTAISLITLSTKVLAPGYHHRAVSSPRGRRPRHISIILALSRPHRIQGA